jgi:hypothetical protein
VTDNGAGTSKVWNFVASTGPFLGLVSVYQEKGASAATFEKDYTWTQDPAGRPYVGSVTITTDPGQTYQAQTKTAQTLDLYGNITQTQIFDYANLTTPARTYNYCGQLSYFFAAWELPGIGWKHPIVPDAIFRTMDRTFAVEYDRGGEGLRYFIGSKIAGDITAGVETDIDIRNLQQHFEVSPVRVENLNASHPDRSVALIAEDERGCGEDGSWILDSAWINPSTITCSFLPGRQ